MNFIHTVTITAAICKTLIYIKDDKSVSVLAFQWLLLMKFKIVADLFSYFYGIPLLCCIGEIVVIGLSQEQLQKLVGLIERIPTDKILTEIKYQFSVVLVALVAKAFKSLFLKLISQIEDQNLTDERQSKLSQQLLDVSQFIELETQNRCNRSQVNHSQFLDQTLNLDYTIIEKYDDQSSQLHRDNHNQILKELEFNSTEKKEPQKQFEQQQKQIKPQEAKIIPTQSIIEPEKKKPQNALKSSIPIVSQIEKAVTNQPKSLRGSVNGVQSEDLDSMRKTLKLLQSSEKKIESIVVENIQNRVEQSKIEAQRIQQQGLGIESNRQIFEKLQQCKEKINKQQLANSNLFG